MTWNMAGGPPRIISTGIIGVTPSEGYYNLNILQDYKVRVIVESGTISYLTRVEGSNLDPSVSLSPGYRDDSISAGTGTRKYVGSV